MKCSRHPPRTCTLHDMAQGMEGNIALRASSQLLSLYRSQGFVQRKGRKSEGILILVKWNGVKRGSTS